MTRRNKPEPQACATEGGRTCGSKHSDRRFTAKATRLQARASAQEFVGGQATGDVEHVAQQSRWIQRKARLRHVELVVARILRGRNRTAIERSRGTE